jgi:hypothetical protein
MLSLMAKSPFYIVNAVAFLWILKSLTATISILKKTKQTFKLKLFNNFYYAVLIACGVLIFGCVLQILLLIFKGLSSKYVLLVSNELLSTLFSLVIFSIMMTMRPTTKSKLLVHHEELQEENTDHSHDHGYGPNRPSFMNKNTKELSPREEYFEPVAPDSTTPDVEKKQAVKKDLEGKTIF